MVTKSMNGVLMMRKNEFSRRIGIVFVRPMEIN